jgi:hypothetical protein
MRFNSLTVFLSSILLAANISAKSAQDSCAQLKNYKGYVQGDFIVGSMQGGFCSKDNILIFSNLFGYNNIEADDISKELLVDGLIEEVEYSNLWGLMPNKNCAILKLEGLKGHKVCQAVVKFEVNNGKAYNIKVV